MVDGRWAAVVVGGWLWWKEGAVVEGGCDGEWVGVVERGVNIGAE